MNAFICLNYIKMTVRYGFKDIRYEVLLFVKQFFVLIFRWPLAIKKLFHFKCCLL